MGVGPLPKFVDEYHQLRQEDQWGALQLYWPDGTAANFAEGQQVAVQWPSGSYRRETIVLVNQRETVSDHGHVYDVCNKVPHVEANTRGVTVRVPLHALKVKR